MNSSRDVASASTSMARCARSAVRMSPPTASSAPTDVMPTIAIGDDRLEQRHASARAQAATTGRSARVGTGHSTPRVHAHDERHVAAAHDDGVGERRARRLKDVLQSRLIAVQSSAQSRSRASPWQACRNRSPSTCRADSPSVTGSTRSVTVALKSTRRFARVVQQADHRVARRRAAGRRRSARTPARRAWPRSPSRGAPSSAPRA